VCVVIVVGVVVFRVVVIGLFAPLVGVFVTLVVAGLLVLFVAIGIVRSQPPLAVAFLEVDHTCGRCAAGKTVRLSYGPLYVCSASTALVWS